MINWKLPTINDPGFLKRRREIAALLDLAPTPENTDKLIDYLAQFVEGDPEEAKEALLDASQTEYGQAIASLLGYASAVSDPKGGKSVPQ